MIDVFGEFELDHAAAELRRNGARVSLEPRVLELLIHLVRNRHRVVSKHEIFQEVWAGRSVAGSSVTVAMTALRKGLADSHRQPRFVATKPRRGYQFIHPVVSRSEIASRNGPLEPPFVGRDEELATLSNLANQLATQRGAVALIQGEPGIGKTRLLEEFASVAERSGLWGMVARCKEASGAPALWPWLQILRQILLRYDSSNLEDLAGHSARNVLSLLDESPSILPGPSDAPAPALRFRLFDSMAATLARLSSRHVLVLAIDDLHDADESSLRLYHYLARELRRHPVMLIATYRSLEATRHAELRRLLPAIIRDSETVTLQLRGLESEPTRALVVGQTGHDPGLQAATSLNLHTGGNPFFIRELAPLLQRGHDLGAASRALPESVREAILHHIGSLTEPCRRFLQNASVLGRDFLPSLATHLDPEMDSRTTAEAIEEAVQAGILEQQPDDQHRVRFVHVLIQDLLYRSLSPRICQELHARAVRALGTSLSGSASMAVIAHHAYLAAPWTDETLDLLYNAATEASQRFAHEEAARLYQRCIEVLGRTTPASAPPRHQLLLKLGAELLRSGERSEARKVLTEAAFCARALGAASDLCEAALSLSPGLLAAEAGTDELVAGLLEEALGIEQNDDYPLKARAAARLATELIWSNRPRAHELLAIAQEAAAEECNSRLKLELLHAEWLCHWRHDCAPERQALSCRLRNAAILANDVEMTLIGHLFASVSHLEFGEIDSAREAANEFVRIAREIRQPQALWYAEMLLGAFLLLEGRLPDAEAQLDALKDAATRAEDANAINAITIQSLLIAVEYGQLEQVVPVAMSGMQSFPMVPAWRVGFAWVLAKLGRENDARREFKEFAENSLPSLPQRFDWQIAVAFAAETCWHLRDRDTAPLLYSMLEPLAGSHLIAGIGVASFGSAARYLALLADVQEDTRRALDLLLAAIASNDRAGARVWSAHCHADLAEILSRGPSTSREAIEFHASRALAACKKLGLPSLNARLRSLGFRSDH